MKKFLILFCAIFSLLQVFASEIPWRAPEYSLTAKGMDLRAALETFGVSEGVPVLMSGAVNGSFSGVFDGVKADEFLDQVTTMYNLMWYYDGAAIYIYGASEISTLLLDLRYMNADELVRYLENLGVEDKRFPIKTASDGELIMVSGPPRYVSLISDLVKKADALREKRTFNEVETRIFPLTHTWADDVSFGASDPESGGSIKGMVSLLKDILADGLDAQVRDSSVTNTLSTLEESMAMKFKPIIKAENRLNAVIIRDVSVRMPMYEKLIQQLDVPQKLVEITVTTLEMSRDNALDWQLSLMASGEKGRLSGSGGNNAGNLYQAAELAEKGGSGIAGAITYLGKGLDWGASLSALRQKGKAKNISRTSLLTVNNMATEISDQQSYHVRVIGTEVATLQEVQAGTTLQIKPRIMMEGEYGAQIWVTMSLSDGGFEAVTVDSMPTTRSTSLSTQAAVYEDDSIMLAGYYRDIDETAGWGIPFLRDIPLIGWIFGGVSKKKETVQRLFIVTPRIINLDFYRENEESEVREAADVLRRTSEMDLLVDDYNEAETEIECAFCGRNIPKKNALLRTDGTVFCSHKCEYEFDATEKSAEAVADSVADATEKSAEAVADSVAEATEKSVEVVTETARKIEE